MSKKKYIITIVIFLVLILIFLKLNKSEGENNTRIEKEINQIKSEKDSLFIFADRITKEIEINDSLKREKIEELQSIIKERDLLYSNKIKDLQNSKKYNEVILSAKVVDTSNNKDKIIEDLLKTNKNLLNQIDSLKLLLK
jgi:hypothetical protein